MHQTLLVVHFMCLAVGIGGGVASAVMGATSESAEPDGKAALGKAAAIVSNIGAVAIALLWITGIWMVMTSFGGGTMPTAFWLKMLGVVALTAAIIGMHLVKRRAAGGPPPADTMKKLGQIALVSATFAVIMAVVTFG